MPKKEGIQISLQALLQIVAAVVISYLLSQVLGMDARMKALEVQQKADQAEIQRQAESIKSLWEKKKSKQ